ncbi:MAG: hypothetical protein MUO26_01350 [Methanotrichaceae archaeon]|nr:hypothetical protein [Methanotrichaceae archaeon]
MEHDGYIMEGNLDISSLKLPKEDGKLVVDSEISITNSQINRFVIFPNAVSQKNIALQSSQRELIIMPML